MAPVQRCAENTFNRIIRIPEKLQGRLNSCKTLPSIPAVVMKIVNMCGSDKISFGQIAGVLSRDPALSATVLKMANSAYYGMRSEVKTLDRAIFTLGLNATLSLVLSYSFARIMRNMDSRGFNYGLYWQRAVITAAAAGTMHKWAAPVHREELFLAGLLQDIGMLALNEAIPEKYGPLISTTNSDHSRLIEIENELLSTDHVMVGAWMLEQWKLPEDIILSLLYSHQPHLNHKPEIQKYIDAASFAGTVAEIWTNPAIVDATAVARETSERLFDMPYEDFEMVLDETAGAIPEITSYLNISIGGKDRIGELLDRAHEALINLNLQAQQQVVQIQNMANHDGLTSLYNRGYLERVLPQYMDAAHKMNQPLSVVFIDIDHFKKINDLHGHQTGDFVLASVAKILKSVLRESDVVVRYGGEEFVCILPNADERAARRVSDRMRTAIASQPPATVSGIAIEVTASFGCATTTAECPYESHTELLEESDRCMYAAKRAGRNRVVASERLRPEPLRIISK